MTPRDSAKYLASLGMCVFPCVAGAKVPATTHGCKDANNDIATVERMFAGPANVGLATGDVGNMPTGTYTRVIVLDDDSAKHGMDSFLTTWQAETGITLAKTVSYRTGGGGTSYIYADPDRHITKGGASQHLAMDIRGDGHYSVVPVSSLDGKGAYEWITSPEDTPIAVVGEAEIALYTAWNERKSAKAKPQHRGAMAGAETEAMTIEGGKIPEGERNNTLFRLAASMQGKGLPEDLIWFGMDMINMAMLDEPVDDAELAKIVTSVINRYEVGDESWWLGDVNPRFALRVLITYLLRLGIPPEIATKMAQALDGLLDKPLGGSLPGYIDDLAFEYHMPRGLLAMAC